MVRLEYRFSGLDLGELSFVNVSQFDEDDFRSMEQVAVYDLEVVGDFVRDSDQIRVELVVVRLTGPVEFGMYILFWDSGRYYISRRCEYGDGQICLPIEMATQDVEVVVYN